MPLSLTRFLSPSLTAHTQFVYKTYTRVQESGGGGGRLLIAPRRSLDPRAVRLSSGSNSPSYDPRSLDPHAANTATTSSRSSSSSTSNSVSQLVGLPIPEPPSTSSSTFPSAHPFVKIRGVPVHMRSRGRGVHRGGFSGEHALVPPAHPSYMSAHYTQQQGLCSYRSSASSSQRASSSMLGVGGVGTSSWGRSTNSRLTGLDSGSALSGRASLLSGPQLSYSSRSSRGSGGHLAYYPHAWERLSAGPFSAGSSGSASMRGMGSMLPMVGVVLDEGRVSPGGTMLEPQPHLSSSSSGNVRSTPSFRRSSSRLGRITSSGSNTQPLSPQQSLITSTGGGVGVGGFDEGMQVVEEHGEEREGEEGEAVAEGSVGHTATCEPGDVLGMQGLVGPELDMLLCMDWKDLDPAAAAAASGGGVALAASTAAGAAAAAAAAAAAGAGAAAVAAHEGGNVWDGQQQQQQQQQEQVQQEQTWQFWHGQAWRYFRQMRQQQNNRKQEVRMGVEIGGAP
ncbi:hypothetical protein DUNSADRAFT_17548 [Dunaliella salina]|uniref:Encoded protein n=1 Tax=Dunaliella salina TaxID=3046 RepID=A0ABQ7G1L9_DUNSA|nr:hypothetical protein DUNSADRAFT_17548 [Dunaliella salina]|eukprot:KAF5828499.1 hypothetical protein DUNSADRAFT_17548 [Dunaliella salina]